MRRRTGSGTNAKRPDGGTPDPHALEAALARRQSLVASGHTTAYRLVDGSGDGLPGLYVDRYGPGAVLSVYDDAHRSRAETTSLSTATLDALATHGVQAVYVKPFARDRSRLAGQGPDEVRSVTPRAGTPVPPSLEVQEYGSRYEVRLYDGLSTGLFLDHREHRRVLAERRPARALNLFAYTCAFAVPLMRNGSRVTNVDVSARYLDWGKRNLALNGLPPDGARFLRRDAMSFLAAAARRDERFDLVVLDPPTFAAGDRQRAVPTWRALDDYPSLVQRAVDVLAPGGVVFAATNTRELAAPGTLRRLVTSALGRSPRWLALPPWPDDVTERGRVAAVLFAL